MKWSRSSPSVIALESEKGNKGTLHQERVRQRKKSLTDLGRSDVYRKSLVETGKTNVQSSYRIC